MGLVGVEIATQANPALQRPAVEALVSKFPSSAEAYALLGFLDRLEGKFAQAKTSITRSLALKPYDLTQSAALARTLIDLQEFKAADEQIGKLLQLSPNNASVAYLAGVSAFAQGNLSVARDNLERVVEAAPGFSSARELAAEVALQNGELSLAEAHAKALASKPATSIIGTRLLAKTYLAMNSPEKSLRALAPLLQAKVNDPGVLALTGEALLRTVTTAKLFNI